MDMAVFNTKFFNASPDTSTPEDRIRQMRALGLEHARSTKARNFVQDFAENSEEGPFDGIIAFSEGAAVAADVILHQARMRTAHPFKCAVFFCGAPPWDYGLQRYLLADESEERIGIPTVSVVGAKDQMKSAGVALYNVCEGEGAVLYEHLLGHLVPRSLMSKKAIVGAVRGVVGRAEESEAEVKKIEIKKAWSEKTGLETTDSETSGSETSCSEIVSFGKNSLKGTSLGLEKIGVHSEWEDVVDMVC